MNSIDGYDSDQHNETNRDYDLSKSLPALARANKLSSMRSQSVSLNQHGSASMTPRGGSGHSGQRKIIPPIPKPRQPPPYPHARLPPPPPPPPLPPPPPVRSSSISTNQISSNGRISATSQPTTTANRWSTPPNSLSTPPLLHSSPYINRSKKPPVVPRRKNQNYKNGGILPPPADLIRPLSGSETREAVMAPLTEHQIMKTLKINLENLHFVVRLI